MPQTLKPSIMPRLLMFRSSLRSTRSISLKPIPIASRSSWPTADDSRRMAGAGQEGTVFVEVSAKKRINLDLLLK